LVRLAAARICPPPVPAATKPATALYADQEIIVTPTAITLAGKTYAARNISSVETYALPPDRTNADNSILIGTILLIVGIWIAGWGIASFLAYDLLGHGPAIGQ
jgi:hypothetical protein